MNNRIGFDTEVLLPNFSNSENEKMSIDESCKAYKNQKYKVGFTIKLDNDVKSKEYRVISKVIKFDENNQYGFAMTKPMAVGAIKEKKASRNEFNILFEKLSLNDKKGHIFIVDIEFDHLHATDCQIMYNEMLPPFIEKDTKIEANKRSVYQLLELYSEDNRGSPKTYKISSKAHSNLFSKKFIPLYFEEIKFAVLRCGWKVTKLYKHYHFDQERFKRNFILMNQKARREAGDKVESDFCKLLNNANFGYDCRNNLDNCQFQPINDEINELSFIKRYHSNLYEKNLQSFITSRVLIEDIDERFNNERQKIKETDKFFAAKVRSIENRRNAENEALESFKLREKKHHQKTGLTSYVDRLDAANKNEKVKTIIDFPDQDTASIKALSIKTNDKVKITTRFIKGKMLMFSKMSLKSFVYDITDIFCFPDEEVKEIYKRYKIIKTFVYLILTDTDSCSLQFTFITELKSSISEDEARKLIFEILLLKKGKRLDTSDEFFDLFLCRNESTKKQVGLYEVESIDNANLVTIAVNPK